MSRQRERMRAACRRAENEFTNRLAEIPEKLWPPKQPQGLTSIYRNNQFIVQVYCNFTDPITGEPCTKVMVRHNTGKPVVQWRHLQDIKNQIFGPETVAVQYLPPQSKLVDSANMYWFFIKNNGEITNEN